ncbi:MAG: STAS domain-containing protein [Planctomycetota bacterium]|nr:STAS domain-containing protein [Planctomycetota bacterium]
MEFYYHETEKDVLILSADGGLNAATAEKFVSELERLIEAGNRKIIVDCSALDYISSYGISVLLRLHKKLQRHGGDVRLASVKGMLVKTFSIVGIDEILSIHPDVNRARLSFRPQTGSG